MTLDRDTGCNALPHEAANRAAVVSGAGFAAAARHTACKSV